MIRKLLYDFVGISRVSGWGTAFRWAGNVALSLPTVLKTRNLLAADARMGTGPFHVERDGKRANLVGKMAFAGLREIWVRGVYDRGGFVQVPDHGTVVDLGANMGNFSAMALAANPTARLIAVEPSAVLGGKWTATMAANNFGPRAQLCRAFLGDFTEVQLNDVRTSADYASAPQLAESDFLARYGIDRIDFLKCDIEGSEFFLIEPGSRMLDITERLAIEVHDFGGRAQDFIDALKERGFADISVDWYGAECIARATRTPAAPLRAS